MPSSQPDGLRQPDRVFATGCKGHSYTRLSSSVWTSFAFIPSPFVNNNLPPLATFNPNSSRRLPQRFLKLGDHLDVAEYCVSHGFPYTAFSMAKTGRPRGLYSTEIGRVRRRNVPLTRAGRTYLNELFLCFAELGRPSTRWWIVNHAVALLFYEYCSVEDKNNGTDTVRAIATHPGSLEILQARWLEYNDEMEWAQLEARKIAARSGRSPGWYARKAGQLHAHNVALTPAGFDFLDQLVSRFSELGWRCPRWLILELALQRLFHEHCLYATKPDKSAPASTHAIIRHGATPEILRLRWPLFNVIAHPYTGRRKRERGGP
jgi:hypothetical protein